MVCPEYLRKNDLIAIVSPAGSIDGEKIDRCRAYLENRGYRVKLAKHAKMQFGSFSGTDEQRFSDLQEALDNPEVKLILCSRGGYGTMRILSNLDWSKFKKNPKWITGFSDITALHNQLSNLNIQSIHGSMCRDFNDKNAKDHIQKTVDLFEGKLPEYTFKTNMHCQKGATKGIITGGNLSVFFSLAGTPYDVTTEDKILFLEDINEPYYVLDRMINSLKMSGKLDRIKGLIIGQMTDMQKENFALPLHEIFLQYVDAKTPVFFGFPAGHEEKNYPLILGKTVNFVVDEKIKISYV
jgi:muramoyltetrapeptide carboxypeptidase